MDREGRGPPQDQPGHGEPARQQPVAEPQRPLDARPRGLPTRVGVDVLDVAVVGLQAVGDEVRQAIHQRVQLEGRIAGLDAGPAHADLEVDQDRERPIEPLHPARRARGRRRGRRRSPGTWSLGTSGPAWRAGRCSARRPDRRAGRRAPRRGDHLGLGDRGALVLVDAQAPRQPDDLRHLVRLDVRPEPIRPPRHRDHLLEVAADQRPVDQERRAQQLRRVVQAVAWVHRRAHSGASVRGGRRTPQPNRSRGAGSGQKPSACSASHWDHVAEDDVRSRIRPLTTMRRRSRGPQVGFGGSSSKTAAVIARMPVRTLGAGSGW